MGASHQVSRAIETQLLRQELKTLRDRNLQESTFEEEADLVAKLGIKILPSEDLKSTKISCRLNLAKLNEGREQAGLTKVTFGGPNKTFAKPETFFELSIEPASSFERGQAYDHF